MKRRAFLHGAVGAMTLVPWLARASGTGALGGAINQAAKPPLPFQAVGPFPEDANVAFGFFLFTCPFCRQHMPAIQAWGASLPPPLRFASSPIPQEPSGLQGARAFYAVRRAAPDRLEAFETTIYSALQDANANADDERTYLAAARAAGIDMTVLARHWISKDVQRDVVQAKVRYERYAVDQTPSIGLAGRYVLHADLTNGDYAVMLNLANGIISQMLPQFAARRPS